MATPRRGICTGLGALVAFLSAASMAWAQMPCRSQAAAAYFDCKAAVNAAHVFGKLRHNALGACRTALRIQRQECAAGVDVFAATVTTDRRGYTPGEVVTMSGGGWAPGETVSLVVTAVPRTAPFALTALAGAGGTFTSTDYAIPPEQVGRAYVLTATGESSGLVAEAVFWDPAAGSLCNTPTVSGCAGATALPVFNPTHYAVQIGTTITSKIIGATDLTGTETCSAGGSGVDVIVKSTPLGNTTLCGSLSGCPGAGCTITFTYTAPDNGCQTEIVAYLTNGNNTNNDIIDDGILNGSGTAAGGLAFVDGSGNPINTCGGATTTSSTTSTTSSSSTSSSSSSSTSTSSTESTTSSSSTSTSSTESTTSSSSTSTSSTESTTSSSSTSTSSTESTTSSSSTSTSSTESTTSSSSSTTETSTSSTTTTTLCTPVMEVCDNMLDDDCDGQIDCMDPDCPPCPPIRREPSSIQFDPRGRGLDRFRSHGRVRLRVPLDDVTDVRVAWLLTNARGIIYQAGLQPGDLTPRPPANSSNFFKDPGAHLGQGIRDGLARVLILVGNGGNLRYKVEGFGDMSAATDPEMTLQFYVGDEVFVFPATWRRTPSGWIAPPPPIVPAGQR